MSLDKRIRQCPAALVVPVLPPMTVMFSGACQKRFVLFTVSSLAFSVLVIIRGLVACHMNDLIKRIIFDCFIKNQIQVIGCGKMIVIRQTMGIGKTGVGRPSLCASSFIISTK